MMLFAVGFFAGVPLSVRLGGDARFIEILGPWFLIFAILQFIVFRCPHCRKLAIITKQGVATPFVGNHCRYCGGEY